VTENTSTSSYFFTGGTVPGNVPSYVERRADSELVAALKAGEFCYVLDTRQVGKSSLMVRSAERLREAGYEVAIVDLSSIGDNLTQEQWYFGILNVLAVAFDLEEEAERFWLEHAGMGCARRFFTAIRNLFLPRASKSLTVFVDEIDAVRKLPFSADEFFAMIRESHNRRSHDAKERYLTFCLIGVATPSDLIEDVRTSPFNIGRRIDLNDFTLTEMEPLAAGLKGLPRERKAQLERVWHWTAGHPYLTQKLCQAAAASARSLCPSEMDALCRKTFLDRHVQEEEDNLKFISRQLLHDDATRADILTLYEQIRRATRMAGHTASAPVLDRLLLSGLVCVAARHRQRRFIVRNRVYARAFDGHWVRANMPGAELRRQRRAARIGFLRASLIWGALAGLLLIAVGSQWQITGQRELIRRRDRSLAVTKAELGTKDQQVAAAKTTLQKASILLQNLRRDIAQQNRAKEQLSADLIVTRQKVARADSAQRSALAAVQQLKNRAADIRFDSQEQSNASKALRGAANSGDEFDALKYGLDAVLPALARDRTPSREAVQGLYEAATAGAYRLLRLRHEYFLTTASFSPDDRTIVTAGRSRFVILWNAHTGKEIRRIAAIPANPSDPVVWTAEFSPDGKSLVTAGNDCIARVWTIESLARREPKCVWEIPCGKVESHLPARFASSGRYLAVGCRLPGANGHLFGVTVWDLATRKPLRYLPCDSEVRTLDFNFRTVAEKPEHQDRYLAVTGDGATTVRVYEYRSGKQVYAWPVASGAQAAIFSLWSDSLYVASHNGTVEHFCWNEHISRRLHAGEGLTVYNAHIGAAEALDVSGDGCLVATGGADDCTVRIWSNSYTREPVYTLKSHVAAVRSVRFSSDGYRIVTASADRTAEVWLLASHLYAGPTNACHFVANSPDGGSFGVPTDASEIWIWRFQGDTSHDPPWQRPAYNLIRPGAGPMFHAAFSPDGQHLATAGANGGLRVWSIKVAFGQNPTAYASFKGHDNEKNVNCVAFSRDGSYLLSASDDKTALLWNAHTRSIIERIAHPHRVTCCALSPDGTEILTGCADGWTRLFDLKGRLLLEMQPGGPRGGTSQNYPWTAEFSPDGHLILTGDADGKAYLWDCRTGHGLATLAYGHGQVFSAQFSRDGRRVVAVGLGGYADIWNVNSALLAARQGRDAPAELSYRISGDSLFGGQFTRDGRYIIVAGADCLARKFPATLEATIEDAKMIRRLGGRPIATTR